MSAVRRVSFVARGTDRKNLKLFYEFSRENKPMPLPHASHACRPRALSSHIILYAQNDKNVNRTVLCTVHLLIDRRMTGNGL